MLGRQPPPERSGCGASGFESNADFDLVLSALDGLRPDGQLLLGGSRAGFHGVYGKTATSASTPGWGNGVEQTPEGRTKFFEPMRLNPDQFMQAAGKGDRKFPNREGLVSTSGSGRPRDQYCVRMLG